MKDTGDLFSKICDMDNLRKAHKNAKRGKGWYAEVKCIEKDLDHYLKRLQHCDSFRLYQKYVEPNVEYMHNYYLKEVKGNAEICKRKNYSGERKAS